MAVSSEASSNGSRAAGFTGVMYLEEGRKEGREEGREGKERKGKEGRKEGKEYISRNEGKVEAML